MGVSLKSKFPDIAKELRPKVSRAVKQGAEDVALAAKARVPIDEGDLKRAIHVERQGAAEYTVVAGSRDEDVFYGHLVEFGTTHSHAQPFLVPALEATQPVVVGRVAEALRELEE